MFAKRKRHQPDRLITAESHDYYLFWYPGSQTYSQTFTFNSPALSGIDPMVRRNLKKRERVYIKNGLKQEEAVLVYRGGIDKLSKVSEQLDHAISDDIGFDTDKVMNMDFSSESEGNSDSDHSPPPKRLDHLDKERSKLEALRHNNFQILNSISPTVNKSGCASSSKVVENSTPTSVAASRHMCNCENAIPYYKKMIEKTEKTNKLLATLIEIQLKDTGANEMTAGVAGPFEFECHDGKKIQLSDINRFDPNSFARKFLTVVHGKENLAGKLLSCKGKTERQLIGPDDYQDVKKATITKFPNCLWKSVEQSANQFLRDLSNPKRPSKP